MFGWPLRVCFGLVFFLSLLFVFPAPIWAQASKNPDLDGNGKVDGQDMKQLLAAWEPVSSSAEDLDSNGKVNSVDAALIIANWGAVAPSPTSGPTPTRAPTPTPGPGGGISPHFGCLLTDTGAKTRPSLPRPGYLETITDPVFGTKITRVTDVAKCSHHYQKDQPWNADGSLLFLWKDCSGGRLLDGRTYEYKSSTSAGGSDRWHPTDPDLMIHVEGNSVYYWNVRTGSKTKSWSFSGYSGFSYKSEGNPSWDGRWVAPYAKRSSDGHTVAFAINMETGEKGPDVDINYVSYIDWVSISAGGNYIVVVGCVHGTDTGGATTCNDRKRIYRAQTGETVGGGIWSNYGFPSHFDLAIDPIDGAEVAVGKTKSGGSVGTIKRRLEDGVWTDIGPEGSHTSTRNIFRPGWAYVTHPGGVYKNEVIAVSFDGKMVERFGYVPNTDGSYLGEGHTAPSPDGRKAIIRANWGSGSLYDYVVELPDGC